MRKRSWRFPRLAGLTERETGAFLAISVLVGFVVGLGAAALIRGIETVSLLVDRAVTAMGVGTLAWLAVIPAALAISWMISRRFAPETMGSGIAEVIEALGLHGGRLRTISIPVKLAATWITVGGGGSGGREGPAVQVGGAIGSSIARRFGLGEEMIRSLVAAGAGAALGASFNAPIAGMLFALEVVIGSFSVRHLSAIVLASVTAAVTTTSLVGEESLLVGRPFDLGSPAELLLYGGLALIITAAAVAFLRLADRVPPWALRRLPGLSRPLVMGLIVAGVAVLEVFVLGGDEPRVIRSGQDVLASFINLEPGESAAWYALAALAVFKILASVSTNASGGSAGLFMPSLVIGGTIGVAFEAAVSPFWEMSTLQPGAFAIVGMATMYAATDRAPLTAILIVFEVTGTRNYGLVLPLMLAATLSTFVTERFQPNSVQDASLARRGIHLPKSGEVDILDTVPVGTVMARSPIRVRDTTPVNQVRAELDKRRSHGAPVIDSDGFLVGIVTTTDLTHAHTPEVAVSQVMTPRPITVTANTPVSQAIERMAALGIGRLPVVADDDPKRLVGLFRREEAVNAYHQALGSTTGSELQRSRLRLRTAPDVRFFEFRIPAGSIADHRAVMDVTWPEGCTLVSVRRDTNVLIPGGTTQLIPGDVITAFGTELSERQIIERLNAGADEPTAEITIEFTPEPPETPSP
jgi:CIC family chloride channel protein